MEVTLLDELLKAFPVLCRIVRIDSYVSHLLLLKLALELSRGILLTISTELLVELLTTIGRSIGLYLDRDTLVRGFLSILYGVLPLLYLVLVEFARADIGLLDLEHDVRIIGLLDDTLESIWSDHR